jgi:hypothetical protein
VQRGRRGDRRTGVARGRRDVAEQIDLPLFILLSTSLNSNCSKNLNKT